MKAIDRDIKLFKELVLQFVSLLGLSNWEISYSIIDSKDEADITYDSSTRKCELSLSTKRGKNLERTALKCCLTLLLADFYDIGCMRHTSQEAIDTERQRVISTLVGVLLKR